MYGLLTRDQRAEPTGKQKRKFALQLVRTFLKEDNFLMKLTLLIFAIAPLIRAEDRIASVERKAAIEQARANEKRADEWRKLQRTLDHASLAKSMFEKEWAQDCAARGQRLALNPVGDPVYLPIPEQLKPEEKPAK